ncbi:MAG: hypothetical protein ACP5N3_04915 [Candidatus Nanoarchaeia archaeon]
MENKNELKPEDVRLFSQTYQQAGGKDAFPNFEPIGFVRLSWRECPDKLGTGYVELSDAIGGESVKIPAEQKWIYAGDDCFGFQNERLVISTAPRVFIKQGLAKMNIACLFNYKEKDAGIEGDAYRRK